MIDIQPGFTFLAPTPDCAYSHLYIVIAILSEDEVLWVSVTTQRDNSDTSCILRAGDHPFIKNDSVVNYRDADRKSADNLKEGIKRGLISPRPPLTNEVFERVKEGAKGAYFMPMEFLKYFSV